MTILDRGLLFWGPSCTCIGRLVGWDLTARSWLRKIVAYSLKVDIINE